MASMPHLVRWHEELSDFGLVVIGMHRQEATHAELRERCTAMGIRFTICDTGSIRGGKAGFPSCAVFGHDGKCVYNGHPNQAEAKIRQAVGAAQVADLKPTKALEPVVEGLKRGGGVTDALKKLTNLKNSGEKATKEQATSLSDKITAGAKKRLEEIKATQKNDPVAAYESAVLMAVRWKGFDPGTRAAEIVMKLKTDRSVMAELKARPALDGIRKLDQAIEMVAKTDDYSSPQFKKQFGPQLKEMKKAYDSMKRQYPDARATKAAFEIVGKYELTNSTKK